MLCKFDRNFPGCSLIAPRYWNVCLSVSMSVFPLQSSCSFTIYTRGLKRRVQYVSGVLTELSLSRSHFLSLYRKRSCTRRHSDPRSPPIMGEMKRDLMARRQGGGGRIMLTVRRVVASAHAQTRPEGRFVWLASRHAFEADFRSFFPPTGLRLRSNFPVVNSH